VIEFLPPPPIAVLVVAGRSSQQRAEHLSQTLLSDYEVTLAPFVQADPTAESVQGLLDFTCKVSPDWIVAIGGGSVLDSAKAVAVLAGNEGTVLGHMRGEQEIKTAGIPVVAIPTTAGSGSEVTPFASITDSTNRQKISLSHDHIYPKFALLDPSMTLSLPGKQTAISGMDALSHAIEGYWSNRATAESDSFGIAAAEQALTALPDAYERGGDPDARRAMLEASLWAGLTISNARTTAVHAVSYPMTVHYHVPHGMACGMLLPSFIRYNAGSLEGKKEEELLTRLGMSSMQQLASAVESMKDRIGLPSQLSQLGLTERSISTIVKNGYRPDRMVNNPRPISSTELTTLLESIL
jgi:alcohol dehydrogenase class IV